MIVYERDSVVYSRSQSPTGVWSSERLVSAAADTASSTRANNMHPAISAARDGASFLVVWERHDSTGLAVCKGRYIASLSDTGGLPSVSLLTCRKLKVES